MTKNKKEELTRYEIFDEFEAPRKRKMKKAPKRVKGNNLIQDYYTGKYESEDWIDEIDY